MLKKRAIAKSFHKAIQSVASFLTSFIKKIPSKYFQYPRVRIYFLIFVALGFSFILSLLLFRPLRQLRDSQPTFPPSTIITKDTGTYSFKNTTNEFTTHFKAKPTEPDSIAFANHLGKISFYTPKTQIFGELNTYSSPISSGSTLTYPNIFPNLDLRYTLSSSRLLEEFIANDRATAVRLTRIQQIAQTSQKYHTNDDGSLTFTNEKNQTVFSIPAPVLYEQKDTTQRSSGIRYEIQANSAGQLTITKVLTAEGLAWINDPKRIFPIVIDLVIDNADTSTNWVSSDTVNTVVSQETTIKEEGSGSVKVQTTAATNSTVDLMEYTSDVNAQAAYVSNEFTATGGTQTTSGIYRIHSFTTSGTFTPSASSTVQALVVAGGGNGGSSTTNDCLGGGGGGAGGLIYNSSFAVTAQAYTITVGGTGANSVFSTLTAIGGGVGASYSNGIGSSGGSGGGSMGTNKAVGTGTAGQGNNGGLGYGTYGQSCTAGGGGGGASAVGNAASSVSAPGTGGSGTVSSISGSNVTYAAGGTGGALSGGGTSASGAANTGNGGNGANGASGTNGTGGSGIVIIRYPDTTLLSYSEATIKTQGTYSLKGVAKATNSLNQTLTRTIASPLDLSNNASASFDIRSTRTGSNIKIGLHDTGGTTTEITPNITSAGAFQTVSWDLSGVSNANKDAIDRIIITIVNADADNTFYVDNFNSVKTSVNNTVTYTTSVQNLSVSTNISFWVRSTVAGSFVRFQFGETTSSEQTYNITINSANTWEQKTWDISGVTSTAKDAITKFAFQFTSDTSGATFYFDDIKTNNPPNIPIIAAAYLHDKLKTPITTPQIHFSSTDPESNDVVYQVVYDTTSAFTAPVTKISSSDSGFANITTPADTPPFNSGDTISYTFSALTNGTTYFYRVRAIDPSGSNTYSSWSVIRSLTIDTSLTKNMWFETMGDQFNTDTLSNVFVDTVNNYVTLFSQVVNNADTVSNWTSSDTVNTPISQETTVKQEGTGSIKVTTTATGGSDIDLMEYSSDANAEAAFVSSYIGMSATGGTVTTSGSYSINTFTSSGTLAVTGSDTAQVLVVAGGGGGGSVNLQTSGGGGAGGVIQNNSYVLTSGSKTVTIGNGGAINTNGQNSVFDTLTAIGGGHGGGGSGVAGAVGGSGGGGNSGSAGGAGTAGQGYAGSAGSGTGYPGGAGGGAAEAGHAQVGSNGGENGGNGIQSSISGTATYYGGGGGGAAGYASPIAGGIGGLGGGGNGSVTTGGASGGGVPGTPNTGGGGGGSNNYSATGIGGSGIVIVRYPTSPVLQSYSEGSIKTQGSYSLKVVAKATNSLSQTLIHTISSPLDLSNNASASFDIRSTSTGSNIKIGLHDTGGTTTEITPNITVANTFQTVSWDLSGVSNANKDAIDKIIITIVNADADNTFYIDNFTSLKTSLNNTVTYTTSAQNLSTSTNVTFWIRSTLAGSTLRFQFGEAASNEQTYNITINNANTWEKKTWDISGIAGAARDAVTQFAFKVIDSTTAQTFYFDDIRANMSSGTALSTPITLANINPTAIWNSFQFNSTPSAGITYQIFYDVSGTPTIIPDSALTSNSTGFTTSPVSLRGLNSTVYSILYLKANFSNSTGTPILYDWGISVNAAPNTPTLDSPANGAINQTLFPILKTTAIDPDGDSLKYRILLCTDSAMTTACQTFDQSVSSTGWPVATYASGAQGVYTLQTALNPGTLYYWKSQAIDPAGSNTWGSTQITPYSFTTSHVPNTPTLDAPANTSTNLILSPVFKTTATDPDSDAIKYKINVCTDSAMTTACQTFDQTTSSTGWSAASYASGAQGIYTPQITLASGTTYYWKSQAIDPSGSNTWGATQTTPYSFTTSHIPLAVTLLTPTDTTTDITLTPTFTMSTLDTDSDYLRYKFMLCTDVSMTTNCQTFNQTISQTGWSGQDTQTSTAYLSGSTATFAYIANLTPNITYYWQAFAVDPAGSNVWSAAPTPFSFTTKASATMPAPCTTVRAANNSNVTVNWTDNSGNEDGYQVWKSTDGALPVQLGSSLAPNTTQLLDSAVLLNHSYGYLIRNLRYDGANTLYSGWCSTATLHLSTGSLYFEGINLN